MEKIELMNNLIKSYFKSNWYYAILPFGLFGLMLSFWYYLLVSLSMLFDLVKEELNEVLDKRTDDESDIAQGVKYLIGFFYVVIFNLVKSVLLLPCGILYYFASILMMIGSFFTFKTTPFGFHTIYKQKNRK